MSAIDAQTVNSSLQQLPDESFKADLATWTGLLQECSGLWGGYALEEPVLESTALKEVGWHTLFAYMHRRFGPPHVGGDPYKDLSAGWMLSTPDVGVFLRVSPSLSGPGFSLAPYRLKTQGSPEPQIETIKAAYRTALLDLLRPVSVRDSWINALGQLDDFGESELDAALLDENEDGDMPFEAERHSSSGYSIPKGLIGGEDWRKLCALLAGLGNGDIVAGRSAAIALMQKETLIEAARMPVNVKRLMWMADPHHRPLLQSGLNISSTDAAAFDAEIESLVLGGSLGLLAEMTPEVVATAVGCLVKLGLDDGGLERRVKNLHQVATVDVAYRALRALPGEEFPPGALPDDPMDCVGGLGAHLKAHCKAGGRQDLSDWVDDTLARPSGQSALLQIIWHIKHSAPDNRDAESMN